MEWKYLPDKHPLHRALNQDQRRIQRVIIIILQMVRRLHHIAQIPHIQHLRNNHLHEQSLTGFICGVFLFLKLERIVYIIANLAHGEQASRSVINSDRVYKMNNQLV